MNQPNPSQTLLRRGTLLGVGLLLALQWWLAVGSKFEASTTSDELVHLTGGLTYWQYHDYRMHPENGNLPQRWAALPAWLSGARLPAPAGPNWRNSISWIFGYEFFYATPGQDHFPLLMAGRAMIALFLTAVSLLVFLWARSLWGLAGGFVALGFCAFSPNFLAHGALVTSDICMTFFLLASVGAYWRHLHDGRKRWWLLSALVFGLACVAKFSAVLLLPMMLVMAAVRWFAGQPCTLAGRVCTSPTGRASALGLSVIGHGLAAVFVIWAFFGFRYAAFNPALPPADHFIRPWEWIDQNIGWQGRVVRAIAAARLLPEAFLYGYAYVIESAQMRSAFLDGVYSYTGWASFFPKAFLYKTTPALLVGIATAASLLGLWVRRAGLARLKAGLYRVTPLLVLFSVYWLVSVPTRLNIGHRHILPTYPELFIFCGALGWAAARAWQRSRPTGLALIAAVTALLGWQAAGAVRLHPYYLAYFSPLAGGPEQGYKHLVDSSLDWGQDLPGLKTWLETHASGRPAYLAYFGTGEPAYYGIKATRLPFINAFGLDGPWYEPGPGLYCIGATMLAHVYSPVRGDWTPELEKEYLQLRALGPLFADHARQPQNSADPAASASAADWQKAWTRYDRLRFARLCQYLRVRRPDVQVGYSILIFDLTANEIAAAITGSTADWIRLIENASKAK